ncbi:hypothetical protein COCCADRAFT_103484, partial [Bipolaris zeicola 26-R-13]
HLDPSIPTIITHVGILDLPSYFLEHGTQLGPRIGVDAVTAVGVSHGSVFVVAVEVLGPVPFTHLGRPLSSPGKVSWRC